MDHIGLDHQVLIDELGRVAIIRPDPADLGRGEIDPRRPLGREAGIDRRDIGEVEFPMRAGQQIEVDPMSRTVFPRI